MKYFFAVCVLVFVAKAYGATIKPLTCDKGTHLYTANCANMVPEATCNEPNPKPHLFVICNFVQCYCDPPTVRDIQSHKCVPLDKCPKKHDLSYRGTV